MTYKQNIVHETSDTEIVQRVMAGYTQDFEFLIRRFNQQLFRIGIAYLKNDDDAQDAMQSAYLKAFEKLSTFKSNASFSTWLIRIMINECLHMLRIQARHEQEADHYHLESYEPDGAQKLIDREMKELLEDSILQLPEKYRVVYVFRAINEFSTHDTARYLDISPENVKVRFHRSKQLIKDHLLKKADGLEVFSFLGDRCSKITDHVMNRILSLPR